MKVSNSAAPIVKDFVKHLSGIDNSKSIYEKFDDFLTLAYTALAKTMALSERADALEAQYMEVVGRYRNKDDVRKYPELLAMVYAAVTDRMDFLGAVAGELGALDARLGQFFTPYEVSRLMVEMTMGDAESLVKEKGFIRVCEPAAGAGGMVLAVADHLQAKGLNPSTSLWIEAVDVSRLPFMMSFVQLSARGLAGRVVWGNSLSLETFDGSLLPSSHRFWREHGNPFANDNGPESDKTPPMLIRSPEGQYELL